MKTAPSIKLPRTAPTDPKGWAKLLKARHERGESLHLCQVKAYQVVLGLSQQTADEREAREERLAIMQESVIEY